jgi:hypothetical protein
MIRTERNRSTGLYDVPARNHVGGLEPVYTDMFAVCSLSTFCNDRFPRECGGGHPEQDDKAKSGAPATVSGPDALPSR